MRVNVVARVATVVSHAQRPFLGPPQALPTARNAARLNKRCNHHSPSEWVGLVLVFTTLCFARDGPTES